MNFSTLFRQLVGRGHTGLTNEVTSKEQMAYLRRLEKTVRLARDFDQPFHQNEFVILDIETTGFEALRGDEILSIGAIKVRGNKVTTEQFYALTKIQGWISKEVEELTGITNKEIANAFPLRDVLEQFMRFIGHRPLIAHHAQHERDFLETYYLKCFQKKFQHRIIDTHIALQVCDVTSSVMTLDEACTHYQVPIKNRHHALGDAQLTAQLWLALVEQLQEYDINTLEQLYSQYIQR